MSRPSKAVNDVSDALLYASVLTSYGATEYFSECAAAGVPLDSPPPSSATATAAANPFKNAGMAMSLSLFVCLMGMVVGGAVVLL